MKREKGLTLIELMVTVAILMIIVSVGVPMYGDYVTRSKTTEAVSILSSTRVQMEQYYQDNRTYQSGGTTTCGSFATAAPAGKYFTFTCTAPTATTYTITATGQAGAGMGGFAYAVDNLNNKTSTFTAPASTNGWAAATPNNCWAVKKGGIC